MVEGLSAEISSKFLKFIADSFQPSDPTGTSTSVAALKENPFPLVSKARYEELLAAADKNKDDQIDREEFVTLTVSLFRAAFNDMDTDKDGQVSLTEFKAANH